MPYQKGTDRHDNYSDPRVKRHYFSITRIVIHPVIIPTGA